MGLRRGFGAQAPPPPAAGSFLGPVPPPAGSISCPFLCLGHLFKELSVPLSVHFLSQVAALNTFFFLVSLGLLFPISRVEHLALLLSTFLVS